MVSSYAAKLGRSVIYRRKLIEELGQIEQALASYMAMYELGKIRVNGYFIERLRDGRLEVYEAPPLEEHQLELDLGLDKGEQMGMDFDYGSAEAGEGNGQGGHLKRYLKGPQDESLQALAQLTEENQRMRQRQEELMEDAKEWLEWEQSSIDIKWYAARVLKGLTKGLRGKRKK